ncbi:MAG: spore germination protein, partial [Firmicutes bacterium]|nr:spore germination protein [Bacillota bacterium]
MVAMWPFTRRRRQPPRTAGPVIPDRLRTPQPQAGPAAPVNQALRAAQGTLQTVTATDPRLVENLINEAQDAVWKLDGVLASLAGGAGGADRVPTAIEDIYHRLKAEIGMSPDIIIRRFTVGRQRPLPALLVFVEGLTSNQMVDQDTLAVLQAYSDAEVLAASPGEVMRLVQDRVVAVGHATTGSTWDTLLTELMGGNTLLFLEGAGEALVLDTSKYPQRSISSPTDERSVRGPQESFNEVSWTSMALLRRRIRTPRLRFDAMKLGTRTHTTVSVAHIEGLTNPVL